MQNTYADASLPVGSNLDAYTWRPLRILTIYRLIVVSGIAVTSLTDQGARFFPADNPELFLLVSLLYLGLSVVAVALAFLRRPAFQWQLYVQVSAEILAIAGLIHATGSLNTGLGTLMLLAVAGGGILASTRMACFFAAVASLVLLLEQIYSHLSGAAASSDFTQSGLIGTSIFATALAGNILARRAIENQALADRRGVDIHNLQVLNDHVVQRMGDGVLAVDDSGQIRLANKAASQLLGLPDQPPRMPLGEVAPGLAGALQRWRDEGDALLDLTLSGPGGDFKARLQTLDPERRLALVFLHDVRELRAQVQQEKLAALGRLTASIAHELRNPLSAIVHAGQLLEEADGLSSGDRRLIEIIRQHSLRLNGVIENVLQLSRRRTAERHPLPLKTWLEEFAADFRLQHPQHQFEIRVDVDPAQLTTLFDPSHLRQVLDNLCLNALVHGGKEGPRHIRLRGRYNLFRQVELDVLDNGMGIDQETAKRLFEPFFTTAETGTGIGLYLCRELCEANQAQLHHVFTGHGSCFRIRFGTAQREIA